MWILTLIQASSDLLQTSLVCLFFLLFESLREKTCLRAFRPRKTQTGLCRHIRWLEASGIGFRNKRDDTKDTRSTQRKPEGVSISYMPKSRFSCHAA